MGFEAFQIVLRGGRVSCLEAGDIIRKLPNVKPDQGFLPTSSYFIVDDGQHVIEIEVDDETPLRVSCRFILSHPASIDAAFIAFVKGLMAQFGSEATIIEDVRPEDNHPFTLDQFAKFAEATSDSIAAKRKDWIAMMGSGQAVTRQELYDLIILPRCASV
jgi:hypothetical protein